MFSRLLRALSLAMLIVGLVGCGYSSNKHVMVLDFENATGDLMYDKLSSAVPEYIMSRMSRTPGLVFLEHQELKWYLEARGMDRDTIFRKPNSLQQLGWRYDVDYFVMGQVSKLGDNFIIVGRLFSVSTGRDVAGSVETQYCRSEEDIYPKSQIIADRLQDQILRRHRVAPVKKSGG